MQQRLIEIFEKVNGVKLTENVNPTPQDIVNDILSVNEATTGTILGKIANYGKQGLLTLAILLTVAQGVQASQMKDVISTGVEYVGNVNSHDLYSALVGYTATLGSQEKTDVTRKQGLVEARIYFENLRDGIQTRNLSSAGKIAVDFALKQFEKNPNYVQTYKNMGSTLQTK